jgi:hypothetical protein
MGFLVLKSGYMPRLLGYVLVAGGFAYVASAYVTQLWPDGPESVSFVLTLIPSVGEFWIIGYLLVVGVRRSASATVRFASR